MRSVSRIGAQSRGVVIALVCGSASLATWGEAHTDTGPAAAIARALRPAYDGLGPYEDALVNPGFAHEPNHPEDQYAGARWNAFGGCDAAETFRGACNDYQEYGRTREYQRFPGSPTKYYQPALFADLKAYRVVYPPNPQATWPFGGTEGLAPWGSTGVTETHAAGDPLLEPHRQRTLPPGAYVFQAPVGFWLDRGHVVRENLALGTEDPLNLQVIEYVAPVDSWVGNAVNTTEQWRTRGNEPQTCRYGASAAIREAAVCNPYRSGWVSDPNDFTAENLEFTGRCDVFRTSGPLHVRVRLEFGAPPYPEVFVWSNYQDRTQPPNVFDATGVGVVNLSAACDGGVIRTTAMLLLPEGNLGARVETTLTLPRQPRNYQGYEYLNLLVDVDTYAAWGVV